MAARIAPHVRREAILRATCGEVMARGFASTRIVDVAHAMGVSSGLVFYHYETKERLLTEAFRFAAEQDLATVDAIVGSRASASRRLGRLLRLYAPGEDPQAWVLWIDAWSQALRMPELQAVSRDLDVRWKDAVRTVVASGVALGEFRCPHPSATAWRLTALLDGLAVQLTVHRGVLSRRQMLAWARTAAALELGVSAATLR